MAGLLLLGALAFTHLLALPAFEDEGSQLHWIRRAIDAGEWLLPLHDGKPLEAWPMVPLVRLGLHPLTVMRALHVVAGMIGAVLTWRLALKVTTRGAALLCGALFAICPFVVYLQRLALSDMFLCVAGLWVLLSVIRLLESETWHRTAVLATALWVASFCKFPVGFVFMLGMPLALLLAPSQDRSPWLRRPLVSKLFAAHLPVSLLALLIALIAALQLRRGHPPGFGLQDFLGLGAGNYRDISQTIGVARPRLFDELVAQLSWAVTVLGLTGVVASVLFNDWRQRWLIGVAVIPMLGIGLFAGFWFPRYLLFTLPPLIVGAVCGWQTLALRSGRFARPVQYGVAAICAVFMGHQSALIIWDPVCAHWSPIDRFQYFEGWSSGYGYPQAAKFLLASRDPPSVVYSLDGHSAYQLQTYLPAQWNAQIKPIWYDQDGHALRSQESMLTNLLDPPSAWIIIAEPLLQGYLHSTFGPGFSERVDLQQIGAFEKPGSTFRLAFYQVNRR
jgi:4-amino-4-deoxy-L-arabinose transferase-like glycosyltransferase